VLVEFSTNTTKGLAVKFFSQTLVSLAVALSLASVACVAESGDVETAGDELSTRVPAELLGSWKVADEASAFNFRPNGTYFRDEARILNGIFLGGRPTTRVSGGVKFNAARKVMTLSDNTSYRYEYKPGKIFNGVFLPGSEPAATLKLTRFYDAKPGQAVPAIVFPTVEYRKVDSYCSADTDCATELADKTWTPRASGKAVCDVQKSACSIPQEECGRGTCGVGTVCCNSLAGICTKPGDFCIQ
jgi:hypothetical protein